MPDDGGLRSPSLRGLAGLQTLHSVPSDPTNHTGEKRIMEKKLHVGNLSYNTTEEQLEALFGRVGTVVRTTLITDRDSGRSKGFGFVEMSDETVAAAAIAQLNGADLDGRAITVAEARPRAPRDSRSSSARW